MQRMSTANKLFSYSEATANEIMTKKSQPIPYCSSYKCAGHHDYKIGKKKDVALTHVNCPDCGEALFWFNGKNFGYYSA